jgi:GT2 family glycosyltransferase
MAAPLISFCIPAWNRPALLAEALSSIESQTATRDFEVVVCDDGGYPETAAVVARFPPDRFRHAPNATRLGPVGNWNACLRAARGSWVMVLHEDDALFPWYLDLVLPRLRPGLAAVCTRTISGPTLPSPARPALPADVRPYPSAHFLKSSMTPFPGVLVSREIALRIGGFDERTGPLADYDFWYRLSLAGHIEVVRAVGAFYRVADEQWTATAWPRMIRLTHLLRLRIAREQFPGQRFGRWAARFFTSRNARAYAARFPERPASLTRALMLGRIPFGFLPSGWVWLALRLFAPRK